MSPKLKRVLIPVAIVLAIQGIALAVYFRIERKRAAPPPPRFSYEVVRSSMSTPDLELRRIDGSLFRLKDLSGKPVLMHFWATWCPPCREELPGLLELRSIEGLEILAVTVDKDWKDVRAFFGGEVPIEVVQDPSGDGYRRFEVSTLPDTYLIAPGGRAVARFGGARDWKSRAARDFLAGGGPLR